MEIPEDSGNEEIKKTACSSHCAGTCLLKVHVKDGVVTAVETDDGPGSGFRCCLKGHAMRQMLYHPDRLLYPLRRVGERGEGKFERISWDEALDAVARALIRVKETYGPGSIILMHSGGDSSRFQATSLVDRLLSLFGGYTTTFGTHSYEGGVYASIASYGTDSSYSSRDNLLKSRLIIMWGWNPAVTVQNTGTMRYLVMAKEAGAEIISVDPQLTSTASILADQWIPIRPCTDAAMLVSMAYVMIEKNLHDQAFLNKYTVGFDQFKNYVMGNEDSVPKTPSWAEGITGVSAPTIEALARKYAAVKPAALIDGIAPGRTAYGEQYHRAAITLAAMTGNIGIPGGNSPGRSWCGQHGSFPQKFGPGLPTVHNPYGKDKPQRAFALPGYGRIFPGANSCVRHNRTDLVDAILKGKAGGYLNDYKFLYLMNCNFLNQIPDINKTVRAFKKVDFVVTHEHFMTPSAKFADIVLPSTTRLERNDVCMGNDAVPAYGYLKKVVEPRGETRSHFEICVELAKRLGIANYSDKTEDEYVSQIIQGTDIPDAEEFKEEGIYRIPLDGPYIAFRAQIEDPDHNPFQTPSGKIEIYSQHLADMKSPKIPPVPKYIPAWEGPENPLMRKYPLQLVTTHMNRRAHTQYELVPWLKERNLQAMTISTCDAQTRGIIDGEIVRVFNDRGETRLPARVTERITPGVVDIPEGAWYDPDENGVDRGGNPNVLTRGETSPGGAFPSNTTLVEVAKI